MVSFEMQNLNFDEVQSIILFFFYDPLTMRCPIMILAFSKDLLNPRTLDVLALWCSPMDQAYFQYLNAGATE